MKADISCASIGQLKPSVYRFARVKSPETVAPDGAAQISNDPRHLEHRGCFRRRRAAPCVPPPIRRRPKNARCRPRRQCPIHSDLTISACADRLASRLRIERSRSSSDEVAPPLANTLRRSARLTIPTSLPPCRTGTRLIRLVSIRSAISPRVANSLTLTTSRRHDVGDPPAWDLMYSAAKREFGENHSLQRERWRSVPVSARRSKSPSVTIPTSCRSSSTMGMPLMRLLIMSFAASWTVICGVAVTTSAGHYIDRSHALLLSAVRKLIPKSPAPLIQIKDWRCRNANPVRRDLADLPYWAAPEQPNRGSGIQDPAPIRSRTRTKKVSSNRKYAIHSVWKYSR